MTKAKKEVPKVSSDESENPPPYADDITITSVGGAVVVDGEVLEPASAGDQGGSWDVLRDLDDASSGGPHAKCRMDGCAKGAVRVWVETSQPSDEWPLCEECELKEFGEETTEAETKDKDTTETPKIGDQKVGASVDDAPEKEEDTKPTHAGEEETWKLRRILSVQDITNASVQCQNSKCKTLAACVWVSNLAPEVDWFSCLDCQVRATVAPVIPLSEVHSQLSRLLHSFLWLLFIFRLHQVTDFGGFPPVDELPVSSLDPTHLETMAYHCSRRKNPTMPDFGAPPSSTTPGKRDAPSKALITPAPPQDDEGEEKEEDAEAWDLTRILSVEDIKDCPIKCSSESCPLPAACVWISNQAPTTKWYSCLDCQTKDFGGWPPIEELPVSYMAKEHMDFLARKCSRQKTVDMPSFPMAASPSSGGGNVNAFSHSLVTPLPDGLTQDDDDEEGCSGAVAKAKKPPTQQHQLQPSKQALAMHQKWQEAAVAMGGKDARIVVSKPKAKKLIFDLLENAFRPMNITDIHRVRSQIPPADVDP
jgi:hypothetical protein